MPSDTRAARADRGSNRTGWLLAATLTVALAGSAGRATAQDSHPIDSALEMMNLKGEPATMPDFVQRSRPSGEQAFIPFGRKAPDRALKIKTPAEVKDLTAELDAARAAQLAGQRPKPQPDSGKTAAKPVKAAPKTATNH